MKKTIRTVWSTLIVIPISVNLFGSTLVVLVRVRTVCQGYQQTTKVTASDSLTSAFVIHISVTLWNDKMLILIGVQTAYQGYQQTTKVAVSKE